MLHIKVQVGKDQEKAQSEKDSHSKNRGEMLHINLALIGQAVLEKKIFENCGRRTDDDDGRTPGACLSYKLTCEPFAQMS